MPHGFIAGSAFGLARVQEHELALFGVAPLAVTGQAGALADLGPDLIVEVIVHNPRTPRDRPRLVAKGERCRDSSRHCQDEKTNVHGALESWENELASKSKSRQDNIGTEVHAIVAKPGFGSNWKWRQPNCNNNCGAGVSPRLAGVSPALPLPCSRDGCTTRTNNSIRRNFVVRASFSRSGYYEH